LAFGPAKYQLPGREQLYSIKQTN